MIDITHFLTAEHVTIIGLTSLAMLIGSVGFGVFVIIQIPEDYFVHQQIRVVDSLGIQNRWIRIVLRIAKNILGIVLLFLGISLLFLPGQGLLTILISIILIDFPRKRLLERRIISQPGILKAANRLRSKFDRPPLRVD